MQIKCNYYYNDWWPGKNTLYSVQFHRKAFKKGVEIDFIGEHKKNQSNLTVKGVRLDDCYLDFIPDGLYDCYPSMIVFLISNASITKLTKKDFKQFKGLKELWFTGCNIKYLPGNLFEHLPNLEIVSFQFCNIEYIDPEILDCLPNIKVVKFNSNTNIDCFFDSVSTISCSNGITLEQMKEKLKDAKLRPPSDFETYEKIPKSISADIKDFLMCEEYKDLKISVQNHCFKAHKFLIIARCPDVAEWIFDNELELKEFDKETFEVFLKYIYEDVMPSASENCFEIIKKADLLGLEKVTRHMVKNYEIIVNRENALDLVIYGKRYGNNNLKEKGFEEIKKMFPNRVLKDKLIDDTEKLIEIINAKKKMDETIKLAIEEFENMHFFD